MARVRQTSRLVLELFLGLQQRFKPVAVTIPRIGDVEAPAAAQLMRSALGYPPEGPVRGLMTRVEAAGILVFRLPFQVQEFDAFSAWSLEREMRPVIALGVGRAGERDRATLAHELGHLALHSSFLGELSTVEAQSVAFAGEFLLPAADMREEFSADLPITLTRLAELKGKWGVSMQFLLLRVEQLRIISPQLKSYWRGKLHKQGWLEEEPVSIRPENPKVLREMLERSFGAPVDASRITSEFGLPARFVKELLAANGREPWRAPKGRHRASRRPPRQARRPRVAPGCRRP
jgi:Zn-dependent peptidase ImmA (M78 family)